MKIILPFIRIISPHFTLSAIVWVALSVLALLTMVSCDEETPVDDASKPPNIAYTRTSITVAVDVAMTSLVPTNTGGAITRYGVEPALPAGLNINSENGTISGTPATAQEAAAYVVTAFGEKESDTTKITITVSDVAFSYPNEAYTFIVEREITPISPTSSAGDFNRYFITPDLAITDTSINKVQGLKLNSTTGVISGKPTLPTTETKEPVEVTYTVTALTSTNKSATTTIKFTVNDQPPADFKYFFEGTFSVGADIANSLQPRLLDGISRLNTRDYPGKIIDWSLAPGSDALPAGLELSQGSTVVTASNPNPATGNITGTPTTAGTTVVTVRATSPGGVTGEAYRDVRVTIKVAATAVSPKIGYFMRVRTSVNENGVTKQEHHQIGELLRSNNTIYLTNNTTFQRTSGGQSINLYPKVIEGQPSTANDAYTIVPAFNRRTEGLTTWNHSVTNPISGTPLQVASGHVVNIKSTVEGVADGVYTFNFVVNDPYFTYNSKSSGATNPSDAQNGHTFLFMKGVAVTAHRHINKIDGSPRETPGTTYTEADLTPVAGATATSYEILPSIPAGLTFNTTTGAIGGTPTGSTEKLIGFGVPANQHVIVGKKADGSFTLVAVRIAIFNTQGTFDRN